MLVFVCILCVVGSRVSGGLMQFETQSDAVDAIVTCNHTPISAESKLNPKPSSGARSVTRLPVFS